MLKRIVIYENANAICLFEKDFGWKSSTPGDSLGQLVKIYHQFASDVDDGYVLAVQLEALQQTAPNQTSSMSAANATNATTAAASAATINTTGNNGSTSNNGINGNSGSSRGGLSPSTSLSSSDGLGTGSNSNIQVSEGPAAPLGNPSAQALRAKKKAERKGASSNAVLDSIFVTASRVDLVCCAIFFQESSALSFEHQSVAERTRVLAKRFSDQFSEQVKEKSRVFRAIADGAAAPGDLRKPFESFDWES
eukprot:ANDGO_07953.mRNA.1 hypothetical protein